MAKPTTPQIEPNSGKKLKRYTILGLLLMAALLFLSISLVWVEVTLLPQAAIVTEFSESGTASAGLVALLLAVSATPLALSLSGKIIRYLIAFLLFVLLIGSGLLILDILQHPETLVLAQLEKHTGITGEGLTELITELSVSIWPWVSLLLIVLFVALVLFLIVTSSRWPIPAAKYSREQNSDDYQTGWGTFEIDDEPESP